ncbi:hypothetical protein [Amnibacterium kyonggiense]|uniref:hypothetical protein n=1 Tax=Amnibacterium kyonggiense TaxID=595671 RepID=UPI00105BE6DE|nr:hypothetical protein [Amnibacterium kyonggiense]
MFFFEDAALEQSDLDELERESPLISSDASTESALDYLFGAFAEPGRENAVAFAFVDAGRTIPAIHATILAAYDGIERSLQRIIRREHPGRPDHVYGAVAQAVFALAAGNSYVNDLRPSTRRIAEARRAAEALIDGSQMQPEFARLSCSRFRAR